MLNIRPTTEKDVPLIYRFIRELAEFEKLLDEVTATEEQIREGLFGERKHAEVIVAEYNQEPVGFALFFHSFSTFLGKPGIYLEDLYVRPEVRSKGIGKELLLHLQSLAKERGCGRLEWAVLNWNEKAIKFYREFGAKPQNEWTVYRKTDL